MYKNVYSEYEVQKQSIKFSGTDETWSDMSCVGSSSEEMEVKVITKSCRGRVEREKVKPTGNGTLTLSLHVPLAVYRKMFNMSADEDLKTGVYAYGQLSMHGEFSIVQQVVDEDDEVKFKAYPRCTMESGISRSIEAGAEEVAELELTVKVLPDDYGNGMYEALKTDLVTAESASGYTGDKLSEKWMTDWSADMMHTTTA